MQKGQGWIIVGILVLAMGGLLVLFHGRTPEEWQTGLGAVAGLLIAAGLLMVQRGSAIRQAEASDSQD